MATNNGGMAVWNKVAANNAGADSTVGFQEGQAPSSLNDSCRALMASAARWRDDVSGALVTTGSSAAYQVSSNQNFVNLTDLDKQIVAFTPHVTNAGGGVTLTVDGFANIPLRSSPNVELPAGVLIQGTPYVCVYSNTDHALYLQGFYGASPYLIPLGGMLDFIGTTAPNSSFVLPFGQAINRTVYSTLFAMVGTTYGTGDGSTTFNIPDLRGRFTAGKDDMGGSAASRLTSTYFGASAATLGAVGGAQSHTLTLGETPTGITSSGSGSASVTLSGGFSVPAITGGWSVVGINTGSSSAEGIQFNGVQSPVNVTSLFGTATGIASTSNNTGGGAHSIVPPAIVVNKILRVI